MRGFRKANYGSHFVPSNSLLSSSKNLLTRFQFPKLARCYTCFHNLYVFGCHFPLSHTLPSTRLEFVLLFFFSWRTIPASTHHSLPVSIFLFLCLQQNWVTTSLVDCQLRHPNFCFVLRQFVTTCMVTSWPPPLVRVAAWSPPEFG